MLHTWSGHLPHQTTTPSNDTRKIRSENLTLQIFGHPEKFWTSRTQRTELQLNAATSFIYIISSSIQIFKIVFRNLQRRTRLVVESVQPSASSGRCTKAAEAVDAAARAKRTRILFLFFTDEKRKKRGEGTQRGFLKILRGFLEKKFHSRKMKKISPHG